MDLTVSKPQSLETNDYLLRSKEKKIARIFKELRLEILIFFLYSQSLVYLIAIDNLPKIL